MVATIVLLMLLGWLGCTAAMTFRAGNGAIRDSQATGPMDLRRISGAPAPERTYPAGDGER